MTDPQTIVEGIEMKEDVRVPLAPGSREPSPAVSAASGFDPSRLPWLHVRGQFSYHSEALITGTVAGLIALRSAIDAALAGTEGEAVVYAVDGEGYGVNVRRCSRKADMGSPPYLDDLVQQLLATERDFMRQHNRHFRDFWMEKRNEAARIARDSDGSGEASETRRGSTEGDSAGPQDIAKEQS